MQDDALTAIERAVGSLSEAIKRYEQLALGSESTGAINRADNTSDERIRKLVLATEDLRDQLRKFQEQ